MIAKSAAYTASAGAILAALRAYDVAAGWPDPRSSPHPCTGGASMADKH